MALISSYLLLQDLKLLITLYSSAVGNGSHPASYCALESLRQLLRTNRGKEVVMSILEADDGLSANYSLYSQEQVSTSSVYWFSCLAVFSIIIYYVVNQLMLLLSADRLHYFNFLMIHQLVLLVEVGTNSIFQLNIYTYKYPLVWIIENSNVQFGTMQATCILSIHPTLINRYTHACLLTASTIPASEANQQYSHFLLLKIGGSWTWVYFSSQLFLVISVGHNSRLCYDKRNIDLPINCQISFQLRHDWAL